MVGLEREWNQGFRRVELNLDSSTAIAIIKDCKDTDHRHGALAEQFGRLLEREWEVCSSPLSGTKGSELCIRVDSSFNYEAPMVSRYMDALYFVCFSGSIGVPCGTSSPSDASTNASFSRAPSSVIFFLSGSLFAS
ncbi:unnamed protein product [Linum tenue]|uniref:RNase H type-1 domain-containing protein n=1 Tax=Linum tenue TaxID=586396 RepID=A0AAV0N5A4_9ROSI|nr:unnamed protein product [Linum tenue]